MTINSKVICSKVLIILIHWFVLVFPSIIFDTFTSHKPSTCNYLQLQPERKVGSGAGIVNVMEELWLQIPTVSSSYKMFKALHPLYLSLTIKAFLVSSAQHAHLWLH